MRHSLTVTIIKTRQETLDVTTLYFARPFDFVAGQYITVYFDDTDTPEGKAYSLSSLPGDELASITVKNVGGRFSTRLCALGAGDSLEISRPYGHFNPENEAQKIGIIAGCGLSPVWSVIASSDHSRHQLHYANKTDADIVYRDELSHVEARVAHYVTRQPDTQHHKGRFDVAAIVEGAEADAHYLLCGSIAFVRDIFRQLQAHGIDRRQIATEIFFEQA